jgi:hypothetical protein
MKCLFLVVFGSMGSAVSSPLGSEVVEYGGPGKLFRLQHDETRLVLMAALQTTVRHPHVLHGVPWKTYFKDFVGVSDTSLFSVGFVVEAVAPLSRARLQQSSAAMRLALLRQLRLAIGVAQQHSLVVSAAVTRLADPSHVLVVCLAGDVQQQQPVEPLPLEEWMQDLEHPNWSPCRQLEKALLLLRSEYRAKNLRDELQSIPSALLREEAVLLLLCQEELFVQSGCDVVWKRVSMPEAWKLLRSRMEQFESRSFARAMLRRPNLWAMVDPDYAAALLCDTDDGFVLETARVLHLVAGMTEERLLECALRLVSDPSVSRRACGILMTQQKPAKHKLDSSSSGELRCAVVLLGLDDLDQRVREEAVMACERAGQMGGRTEQSRLLVELAKLLGRFDVDGDERLAALDAAQALVELLAKPALQQQQGQLHHAASMSDLVLPPFPHRNVFAREGLQPLDELPAQRGRQEEKSSRESSRPGSPRPSRQDVARESSRPGSPRPSRQDVARESSRPGSPRPTRQDVARESSRPVSPRAQGTLVPNLALAGIGEKSNSDLTSPKRSPRLQQLMERPRSGSVGSPRSSSSSSSAPARPSPRARSSSVVAPPAPVSPPSDVLRMSPRVASKNHDDDDDNSD